MHLVRKAVNIAPDVLVPEPDRHLFPVATTSVPYNPPAERLYAPVAGPTLPGRPVHAPALPHLTGIYEKTHLSEFMFQEQFRANNREGCPEDAQRDREVKARKAARDKRRKRVREGEEGADEEEPDTDDEERKRRKEAGRKADPERMKLVERKEGNALALEGDEEKEGLTVYFEEDEKRGLRVARYEALPPRRILHIPEVYDYQGRTFMHDPLRDSDRVSYLPKKQLHTHRGHNKGVHAIRWFPPHGHLLLSAGFDGKVKLWDVLRHRDVIQTYIGHAKAVKDICFNNDGTVFVSAGFDRFIRFWDTETGKVTGTYTTGRHPNCLCIHPDPGKQSTLLVGMGDKKIVQWDHRTGLITQQYDQHLGPVNTITFIDNNTKFVTTADDKTIRVWEWDIPFAIKYLADPGMSAMPTCTPHPSGKFIAYQAMDNSIKIYTAGDRFRQHKKIFRGHVSSGYACQIAWSPDGKYLCCGDGDGFANFWEWKNSRIVKRMKMHDKVCIGLLWHPVEQSRLASCSWDSTIKQWD